MELNERPLVLLLSILKDNQIKTLKEIALAFERLLKRVSVGVFRPDELAWLNSVEFVIEKLRQKSYVDLVDHESYKFQITVFGGLFFEKNRAEMEKYLGNKL